MLNRRLFAKLAAAGFLTSASDRPVFANAPTEKRFILINLRGAMDGLHALIPYADADYHKLRPTLGLGTPGTVNGVVDIDGSFGIHPSLKPLREMFDEKELLFVPAVSSQYRERSHFEAQNLLEGGGTTPYAHKTGWLNRAIDQMGDSPTRLGLSIGPVLPLMMQGPANIRTWSDSRLPEADEGFLSRVETLYRNDPLFHKMFVQALQDETEPSIMSDMRLGDGRLSLSSQAAVKILKENNGPRIALIEAGGWDTHFAQERRLSRLFTDLASSLSNIKEELGSLWENTAVLVVSEFGRTAAENGSNGTDHGTGGLAILAGGSVSGGKIAGSWPGLSRTSLLDERDLFPANHLESLFKSTLIEHLDLEIAKVEDHVFPGMRMIPFMENLYR